MFDLERLADEMESRHRSVEVENINEEFGYIEFSDFPTNFNGPLRTAMKRGHVVSALNHRGDTLRLYFTEITMDTIDDGVHGETEIMSLDRDNIYDDGETLTVSRFEDETLYADYWYAPGSGRLGEPERDDARFIDTEFFNGWAAPVKEPYEDEPAGWAFAKVSQNFGWSDEKIDALREAWMEAEDD